MPEELVPQTEIEEAEAAEAVSETIETSGEEEISVVGGGLFNLLTPEGVIMMPIAMILDLVGIILIFFALDDFGITDIVGTIIIGGWLFFRSGTVPSLPERAKQETGKAEAKVGSAISTAEKAAGGTAEKAAEKTVQKAGTQAVKSGRWLKPLLCGLGEWIPYLGVIPFWTYLVYSTLTSS